MTLEMSEHLVVDSMPPVTAGYQRGVPDRILAGGREQLIARVGRDFFEKYIAMDSSRCEYSHGMSRGIGTVHVYTKTGLLGFVPHWTLRYRFRVPGKPWATGPIEVYLDPRGWPIDGAEIEGIGNCVTHPAECLFSVNRERALQIARKSGLEEGIRSWYLVSKWVEKPMPRFVWQASNTISIASNGCTSHGHIVVIDASSGQVLSFQDFDTICD